jgi:hypothetical protein
MGDNGGCCCLQCVRTKEVAVVEDLGNFERLLGEQNFRLLCPKAGSPRVSLARNSVQAQGFILCFAH